MTPAAHTGRHDAWPWVVGAALLGGVTASLLAILPDWRALGLAVVLAAFLAPGIVLGWRLYRGQPGGLLGAFLFGPALGYALSSLALLLFWALGFRSGALLALAPLVAVGVAIALARLAPALTLPRLGRADLVAACLVLLIVPLVVARPYARVGAEVPEGRAYRAYFTADFVWAVAVVTEVSKGDLPPRNMFFRGDDLRYYWFAHLLPAVEHRAGGSSLPAEKILLVNDLLLGLTLVGFLYLFVRHFVESPPAAAAAVVAAVLFSSFEGAAFLWRLWAEGRPLDAVRYVNIDAITRWSYRSMPVDGLHRLLLYQPQHQLGYILGLSALLLVLQAKERLRPGVLFLAGICLGASLLLSSFAALMLGIIVAAVSAIHLAQARRLRELIAGAVAGAAPVAGAVALSQAFRYVDTGGSLVAFGLNETAARNALVAVFLSFGPMLLAAIAGAGIAVRRRSLRRFWPLLAATGVCWLFYFLVDVPEHQHVYVGWRAGHLLFVAFAAFCGYWLQEGWRAGGVARTMTVLAAAAMAAAAAPMTAIDLFNTQDIGNRARGPGFRWTVILSPDELEAMEWLRRSTPPSSIVQVEPVVRGRDTWAYVPTFAERRMSAGLPISMIPLQKYEAASERIKRLYQLTAAQEAHAAAGAACIDYLVVGPPERAAYARFEPMLDANPEYFAPAYRNPSVAIYAVTSVPVSCTSTR